MTDVETIVDDIVVLSSALADAVHAEMALEDTRHVVKMTVTERIMATENKLTGKPHSFSSAEAAAVLDPAYVDHLAQLRDAAKARILARGKYDAAVAKAALLANKK
ncbi:hypothetical protein EBZ39_04795 [bacterium]|nr:hypothetical protein [bacterium]